MYLAALDAEKVIVWHWPTRRRQSVIKREIAVDSFGFSESLPLLTHGSALDYFLLNPVLRNAVEGKQSSLADRLEHLNSSKFIQSGNFNLSYGGVTNPGACVIGLDRGVALWGALTLTPRMGRIITG